MTVKDTKAKRRKLYITATLDISRLRVRLSLVLGLNDYLTASRSPVMDVSYDVIEIISGYW